MHKITLISTMHEEIGKCNADELCDILERLNPEVIFLEALEETYSNYDKMVSSSFGVYHKKLEIKAIQKYCENNSCKYIPVLDNGLADSFERKYKIVCQNREMQELLYNFYSLVSEHGFKFLNSVESVKHQEQMRLLEKQFLINSELELSFNIDIDEYENSMMRNIYSYCKDNRFTSAIFLCGVAHRKSIIEKIVKFNTLENVNINWVVYEN